MIKICDICKNDFIKRAENKKIVCFGAGKELEFFFQDKKSLIGNILFVVDNYKKGENINVHGVSIKTISFDEVQSIDGNILFLITTIKHATDFVNQMENTEFFDDRLIYVSYMINRYRDKIEDDFEIKKKTQRIPKTIHYCWFGKTKMPDAFCRNVETWKKYNPDYEIILWNEDNYDISKNVYMRQAYENKKWGFVPDYARLDIVNTYGGIYLDTDVEAIRSFDELLGYDFYCGFEDEKYIALGLGFGATKNNPILSKMLEQYEGISFVNEDGSLNLIASPVYQTEVMKSYGVILDGKSREYENSLVLSSEYFAPLDSLGIGELTDKTFSIHQYAASWFSESDMMDKKAILENMKVLQKRIWDQ